MTKREKLLLKQWIICEEMRLAQNADASCAQSAAHPTRGNIVDAAVDRGRWLDFCEFARKLDALLHIFPSP